jgi:hypothetical protein
VQEIIAKSKIAARERLAKSVPSRARKLRVMRLREESMRVREESL